MLQIGDFVRVKGSEGSAWEIARIEKIQDGKALLSFGSPGIPEHQRLWGPFPTWEPLQNLTPYQEPDPSRRCAMKDAVKKAQKTIAYESYNYNPGEDNPFYIVGRILAGLPGGEALEDAGIKPAQVGWRELQLIADILTSVENADDVKQVADAILHPEKYLD